MGWFTTDDRSEQVRAGTAVPTRSERQTCWLARDSYFACLDLHSIDDPIKNPGIDKKECKAASQKLDQDCAREWVKYFKQWRVADLQKKRRLDELRKQGAVEMEVTSSFAPEGGVGEKGKGVTDIQGMLEKQAKR